MKREHALSYLRLAGYHGDQASFTRLYIENRVSLTVAREQFRIGAQQRANGIPCSCSDCKSITR